jgi:hypothetical protein
MKINEIDPGSKNPIESDTAIEKIVQLLTTECSDAISAMQTARTFLYRGIDFEAPAAFHGRSRENRNPLHSRNEIQNNFNQVMNTYGFITNRSNCIFCTTVKQRTSMYGYPYLIFPKNGFGLLWSPAVMDLFTVDGMGHDLASAVSSTNQLGAADAFVKQYQYTDSNFSRALSNQTEIMINGEYYAFAANKYSYTYAVKGHPDFESKLSKALGIPADINS